MGSEAGTVCCGACFLIGLNAFLWGRFSSEIEFYNNQLPGRCLDGRLFGEPVSEITGMGVDDTKKYKNSITMRCVFRVAFYPCSGVDDYTDYDGSCDSVADQPLFTNRASWPLRAAGDAGVQCTTHGSEACGDEDWDCSDIGRCDGYEKAVRLCASKLKQQPYPCYMVPDNLDAGVRDEASSFPVGWLVGGILVALVSLACCCFILVILKDEENVLPKLLTSCIAILCMFGVASGIGYAVRAAFPPAKQHGTWETTLQQLAETNSNLNATDVLASLVAEEPVDSLPAWAIVLIIVGSIVGFCCLGSLCLMCVDALKSKGEEARETAVAAGQQEDTVGSSEVVELKVGSYVTLSDGWDGKEGVMKPGDVGMVVFVGEVLEIRQVCFQGHYWNYPLAALKASEEPGDGLVTAPSNMSLRSNNRLGRSATQDISRRELARSVSSASNLSRAHVVGHAVLHTVEGHQQFLKRAFSKTDFASASKASAGAVVVAATVVDTTFLNWQEGFKFQKGDVVMVASNLDQVKTQCSEGAVTWDDSKSAYLGGEGTVKGTDWIGPGIRIGFPDGHWWSFPPQSLLVKTTGLDPDRRAALQPKGAAVLAEVAGMQV